MRTVALGGRLPTLTVNTSCARTNTPYSLNDCKSTTHCQLCLSALGVQYSHAHRVFTIDRQSDTSQPFHVSSHGCKNQSPIWCESTGMKHSCFYMWNRSEYSSACFICSEGILPLWLLPPWFTHLLLFPRASCNQKGCSLWTVAVTSNSMTCFVLKWLLWLTGC